jgi:hypothetical protein
METIPKMSVSLMIRRSGLLLSVCLALFVALQFTDRMVYAAFTQERPLPPVITGLINLLLQGGVIFIFSFLIIRKKKYDRRYWIPSLLIVLMIDSLGNPNFHYSYGPTLYPLYIISSLLIGIASMFLSTRVRTRSR